MKLQREDLLMYGGVAFFVAFILYDTIAALVRRAFWLPSKYLVLYGLILQLAAVAEVKNVNVSGPDQQEKVQKLIGKQLSVDSARLTLCVFVGYLLPGMATTAYSGVWTTIAALLVSLISHISIECYIVIDFCKTVEDIKVRNQGVWLIVSGGALLVLLVCFFLLLVWAVFAGKFYRDNLSSRIAAMLDQNSNNVEMEWESFKEEMLKSWIVARICRPEYILTRSVFSAGVGLVVSICVAFFGAKVVFLRSLLIKPSVLFFFQSIFILAGLIVILYRWLATLYYSGLFSGSFPTRISEMKTFIGMFSTPFIHLFLSLNPSFLMNTWLQAILFVLLLPLYIGLIAVILLIELATVSSMLCLLISSKVFGKKFMRSVNLSSGEFDKYKVTLESLRMPLDDIAGLWVANEHFFHHVKRRMEETYEKGRNCEELIEVIQSCVDENNLGFFSDKLVEPLPNVKKYFPRLKEPLWSISAVSLLSIIIEVTPPSDVDNSAVDNAVKAYNQGYSLMKLVDCLDNVYVTVDFFGSANLEAFIISKASLVGRRSVNKSYEKRKGKRGESENVVTVEGAVGIIRKKVEAAEHYLREKHMLEEVPSAGCLGADWFRIAQSYADYKVCNLILRDEDSYCSVEELRKKLLDSLTDVISSCVLQLPHLLLNSSKGWAADFAEEKIYQAAKMVGTARGVIDAARRIQGTP